ncbi:UNVERIFIED_CONTAM: hypothetical protein HDU68_004116 [Siphonaria sp. JEL0065]|nr:hypothetical protein HDU68_004116 [Siphonaria sp. JEL0065]
MHVVRFFLFAWIAVSSTFAAANITTPAEANVYLQTLVASVPLCLVTCLTNATSITPALVTSLCGLMSNPNVVTVIGSATACIGATCGDKAATAGQVLTNLTASAPDLMKACTLLASSTASSTTGGAKTTGGAAASSTGGAKTTTSDAVQLASGLLFGATLLFTFWLDPSLDILISAFQAAPSCFGKCLTGSTNSTISKILLSFCNLATTTNDTQQAAFGACISSTCAAAESAAIGALQTNRTVLSNIQQGCIAALNPNPVTTGGAAASTTTLSASTTKSDALRITGTGVVVAVSIISFFL